MRRVLFFVLTLMLVSGVCAMSASAQKGDFYVSPDGSDNGPGSLSAPFATLARARDAVRELRALRKTGNTEPAVITLREGRHQLNQTLVLGLEDGSPTTSGDVTLEQYGAGDMTGPAFLTFAAYPGETPVLSAGVPVTGWTRLESAPSELPAKARAKVWVADMPEGMDRFYTLYDSRGRLNRARNTGFAYTKQGDQRTLHFPEGALKNWDNLEDVEIQVRPGRAWAINMLPLASVDEASGVATTGASATYGMGPLPGYLHKPGASVVWVENILEALDKPGEWVVNTKTRKIYLWPSDPAPDGAPRGILAPTTTELIHVEGAIDYDGPTDTPVRGIAFSGLTFSHADRWAWTSDENRLGWGMQHDWDMFDRPTALLRFRGAEDCRVTDCKFVNSGGSGIRLDLHAQRNRITNCELAHLGEAGILLAGYGPGTKDANHHNDIVNNYIHHFSEITWHSPGLWAWQSGHNRIVHNELHHSGYSAVLITTRVEPDRSLNGEGGRTVRRHEIVAEDKNRPRGGYESWKIREKYNHSRHNLFEYNEISHSVQLLSDGNGIYISGTGKGNIVRYNYLHDNQAHSLPAAIRCDDDQHDTLIYGNVLYNNGGFAAGIASKGVNDIINNFIVAPAVVPRWGYISFEWAPVTGSKAQRNIIMSHPEGGNAYAERLRGGNRTGGGGPKLIETDMDSNLYYHPTDPHWVDEHLHKMRAVGKEKASLFGDPLFVNPAGGDFSFRPGSPALALGIEPLDVSKMGRLDKRSMPISDGSRFAPKDNYPRFTWDRIPLYMHIRKATSYTDEEIAFLAKFPLITFEKANGHDDHGSIEAGTLIAARAVKEINPDTTILYYRNVMVHYGGYAANKGLEHIPGALLRDEKGGTKLVRNRVEAYDLSNPDLRTWWVDNCSSMTADPNIDGIFLDGNVKALEPGYLAKQIGAAKKKQTMDGYHLMMKQTREAIGPNELMFANILRARFENAGLEYLDYFDGSYLEGFFHNVGGASYEEYVAKGIDGMQKAARQGKIIAFSTGFVPPGNTSVMGIDEGHATVGSHAQARAGLTYPLAIFLVCAEKHSYFRIHEGYSANENDRWMRWFPEYDRPLGPPNGPATKDGFRYSRSFQHAKVQLDIHNRTASIQWQETATGSE